MKDTPVMQKPVRGMQSLNLDRIRFAQRRNLFAMAYYLLVMGISLVGTYASILLCIDP